MNGAIFFSSRYGSTAQYARWIADATGLPAFDVKGAEADPSGYDFLVLGSPIIYHRLIIHKWVKRNLASIANRPAILFSVSGAGAGPKLDAWIGHSLPAGLIADLQHFALRGRQNPNELTWFDRSMLIIGGLMNRDRVAGREEMQGFDFMDRSSIEPIVERIRQLQESEVAASKGP
ncbi:MAG: flavodoxin domain-containing protein [Paracoccaceae bacterium]|nr:flavodoxin domain-containing protein [Paracoccaceae bacterium]